MAVWLVSQISRTISSSRPAKVLLPSGEIKHWLFVLALPLWEVPNHYKLQSGFPHRSSDELEEKTLTSPCNESTELGFDVLYRPFFSSLLIDL